MMAIQRVTPGVSILASVVGVVAVGAGVFLLAPKPETPGSRSSPTLAQRLNESLDLGLSKVPETYGGRVALPEARQSAQLFLEEVAEVVSRCSSGPWQANKRSNSVEYHLTRVDGVRSKPIHSGRRCTENPIIFRAVFKEGRVAEVYTDGRERKFSVAQVQIEVSGFGRSVVRSDELARPARYYAPEKSEADVANQC